REINVENLPQRLAVELLAEARGVLQVAEDHGDGLAHLFCGDRRRQVRAAVAAQAKPIRVLLAAARTAQHLGASPPEDRIPGRKERDDDVAGHVLVARLHARRRPLWTRAVR